jgi:hypothetical protein
MYTTSTRKNGRLRTTVVKILTSVGFARYNRAAIVVVAHIRTVKQAQYMAIPALVGSVAANVGLSRESGSIPPATMRSREMIKGTCRSMRTHCMRRPLGLEVMFRTLEVDMKRGVKLIDVRMATPVWKVVLDALEGGNIAVEAKSSATCSC